MPTRNTYAYVLALLFIERAVMPRIAALEAEQARFDREFEEIVGRY